MVGMENLVPRWLHREHDMVDDPIEPPPIAMLPEQTQPDDDAAIFGKAAVLHAQLARKLETAQVNLIEAEQKIAFLEKENSELRVQVLELQNNMQTLATQMDADRVFMSVVRRYLDARDIKSVPKKIRNGKTTNNAEPAPPT